jgi:hypothetical protein
MAIVGTQILAGGILTPSTAQATGTIDPAPASNSLLLLDVVGSNGGGTAPAAPSSVTGLGLTWVQVATRDGITDGISETWRVTRFRALGASPTTGALTINHGTAPNQYLSWKVREYTGVVTTGTNGSGAVVQTVQNGGTGTTVSATLAAFADGGNGADAITVSFGSPAVTPEAGWTGYTAETTGHNKRAMWRDSPDTSVTSTLATSQVWAMFATEIASAGGGTTESVTGTTAGTSTDTATDTARQGARAVSTTTATGWSAVGAASIHAAINETPASDSEYAQSVASPSGSVFVTALDTVSTPAAGTVSLAVRHSKDSAAETITQTIEVREGYVSEGTPGTVRGTATVESTEAVQEEVITVTGVTNWAALSLRVSATAS